MPLITILFLTTLVRMSALRMENLAARKPIPALHPILLHAITVVQMGILKRCRLAMKNLIPYLAEQEPHFRLQSMPLFLPFELSTQVSFWNELCKKDTHQPTDTHHELV